MPIVDNEGSRCSSQRERRLGRSACRIVEADTRRGPQVVVDGITVRITGARAIKGDLRAVGGSGFDPCLIRSRIRHRRLVDTLHDLFDFFLGKTVVVNPDLIDETVEVSVVLLIWSIAQSPKSDLYIVLLVPRVIHCCHKDAIHVELVCPLYPCRCKVVPLAIIDSNAFGEDPRPT